MSKPAPRPEPRLESGPDSKAKLAPLSLRALPLTLLDLTSPLLRTLLALTAPRRQRTPISAASRRSRWRACPQRSFRRRAASHSLPRPSTPPRVVLVSWLARSSLMSSVSHRPTRAGRSVRAMGVLRSSRRGRWRRLPGPAASARGLFRSRCCRGWRRTARVGCLARRGARFRRTECPSAAPAATRRRCRQLAARARGPTGPRHDGQRRCGRRRSRRASAHRLASR